MSAVTTPTVEDLDRLKTALGASETDAAYFREKANSARGELVQAQLERRAWEQYADKLAAALQAIHHTADGWHRGGRVDRLASVVKHLATGHERDEPEREIPF